MDAGRIKRYGRRSRRDRQLWRCGCTVLLALVTIMMCAWLCGLGVLTPMALRLAGVDRLGNTKDIFDELSPGPTVIVRNRNPGAGHLTIWLGSLGSETLTTGTDTLVSTGNVDDGTRIAQLSFTEPELMNLCRRHSELCNNENGLYHAVSIDLRSGGAVIYLDAGAGIFWQRVGIVLQLDSTGTRFYVSGVDVNGIAYDPISLPFGLDDVMNDLISQTEHQGNIFLRDLAVGVDGEQFRFSEAAIDDTMLILTLR